MQVTRIKNPHHRNIDANQISHGSSEKKLSQEERIYALSLICLGGFLLSWATYEAWGRMGAAYCEKDYDNFRKYCFSSPFSCPFAAFDTLITCPMKFAYEKVGSFGVTVGLFVIPGFFTIHKLLKEEEAKEKILLQHPNVAVAVR